MNGHRVLHLKYRPKTLGEVVGQDVTVNILRNAISSGRVANAFLFTGPRGLGKTSLARILAKTLNCMATINGDPCNACHHCTAIDSSEHVDVLEMDAASRTSVDDIRQVIEDTNYSPVTARYKVYILDEAHMLSKSAFNALLKTLEETPARVKFILATTELRKIPFTVVSRCQRFLLSRVSVQTTAQHLKNIAQKEQADIEEGALEVLAQAAQGSMRDALSMTEQLITLHGQNSGTITKESAISMLGIPDDQMARELLFAILDKNCKSAVQLIEQCYYDRGCPPSTVMSHLLTIIHNQIMQWPGKKQSAILARLWDLTLRAIEDINRAPNELHAANISVVRLALLHDVYGDSAPAQGSNNITISTPEHHSPVASQDNVINIFPDDIANDPRFILINSLDSIATQHLAVAVSNQIRNTVNIITAREGHLEVNQKSALAIRQSIESWTESSWSVTITGSGVEFASYSQWLAELEKRIIKSSLNASKTAQNLMQIFGVSEETVEIVR